MRALLIAAVFCCTALLSWATARPGLTGTVLDSNGAPLSGVTVMVYHAGVKVGYSTFCPSCYLDCGKRTITDKDGTFQFKDLAPDLWFTLLAARDGSSGVLSIPHSLPKDGATGCPHNYLGHLRINAPKALPRLVAF